MPVLPLDCHLPTQYTTHTIKLQWWTNNKRNKGYKQLMYIYISHVKVTQTVPDISPLMPMHQDPLLVSTVFTSTYITQMLAPIFQHGLHMGNVIIPPHNEVVGGILVSLRPSVHVHLHFWLNPFHIYTFHQATSEGVSHVKFFANFKIWIFLAIF